MTAVNWAASKAGLLAALSAGASVGRKADLSVALMVCLTAENLVDY